MTETSVAERTIVREEPNLAEKWLDGPVIETRWQAYALRSLAGESTAPVYLYVILKSERPLRIAEAWHDGTERDVATHSTDPGNCTWAELPTEPGCLMRQHLLVTLTDGDLAKAARDDWSVTFVGPRGARELLVPAAYTRGYLSARRARQTAPNTR